MLMPATNPALLAQAPEIAARLRQILGHESVIADPIATAAYECDGLIAYRQPPLAVVLPRSAEEVSAVLAETRALDVPVVPRGAGTSLSGGALPVADGIVLCLSRMNRILEFRPEDRCVRVEAGTTNLAVTEAVAASGFFYAPDPSSQLACQIGGNIAMNAGGAHCLKYGVTANNLLGLRLALADGELVDLGGPAGDGPAYDLTGLVCGSEGQLGVVVEAWLKVLPAPPGSRPTLMGFDSAEAAGSCVADIIQSGVLPSALEYMDRPAIEISESFSGAGYPSDAEALLIVEVEGSEAEIADQFQRIRKVAARHRPSVVRESSSPEESARIWMGRKAAFGAMGRLSDYLCMDGVIPTGQLPNALRGVRDISERYGLRVANIFHAGDGNLHPLIMFDINDPQSLARAEACGADILRLCVEMGGCLTGEHGVGVEKRDLMPHQYTPAEIAQQEAVRAVFDPDARLNPGKVFPLNKKVQGDARLPPGPDGEAEVAGQVRAAAAVGEPLEIQGGGSRPDMGGAVQAARTLSTAGLQGIRLYEPGELSLTVAAGTPLAEVHSLLAEHGQMLAFEPPDLRALFGTFDRIPTIGGAVAAALSGPRRLTAGGCRDAITGLRFVNGRGETLRTGGRVMKNVAGYSLARLLAGSHGTLGVITEISFKAAPRPETQASLALPEITEREALTAMARAASSDLSVTGACWKQDAGGARCLLRLEGFEASVRARIAQLEALLAVHGESVILDEDASEREWAAIRDLALFAKKHSETAGSGSDIWRLAAKPSRMLEILDSMGTPQQCLVDLAGGLLFAALPEGSTEPVQRACQIGAKALRMRGRGGWAPSPPAAVARLYEGLRTSFDPAGILNPGRMEA